MKRAIHDLWNGNIPSAENCGVGDPEIESLIILIEKHKDQLNNDLGQQHKLLFEKYVDRIEDYVGLITECAFAEGFSLAIRLITEALSDGY